MTICNHVPCGTGRGVGPTKPNALDALKPEDVPERVRAYFGGGDAKKAPPELIGVLGDPGFRTKGEASNIAYSPNGKILAVGGKGRLELFDTANGRLLRTLR